jgi:hypothetical protein
MIVNSKANFTLLKSIKLYCRFRPKGCNEIMPFDKFESHQAECGECNLCQAEVIKEKMNNHYANVCPKYNLQCNFCLVKGDR